MLEENPNTIRGVAGYAKFNITDGTIIYPKVYMVKRFGDGR